MTVTRQNKELIVWERDCSREGRNPLLIPWWKLVRCQCSCIVIRMDVPLTRPASLTRYSRTFSLKRVKQKRWQTNKAGSCSLCFFCTSYHYRGAMLSRVNVQVRRPGTAMSIALFSRSRLNPVPVSHRSDEVYVPTSHSPSCRRTALLSS